MLDVSDFDMKQELWLGDCLELMKNIPDKSIDMILCDLPYNVTACSWDIIIPFDKLWEQYNRITKNNSPILFTATQPFSSMVVMSNIKKFKYEWIWRKNQGTNPMLAKKQPLRNHESILVFYDKSPVYNPQMWQSTPYKGFKTKNDKTIGEVYSKAKSEHRDNPDGTRYPLTVQEFKMDKGLHPTQKPITLCEYLIKTYTNYGGIVLDPTMGSGTTCLAAKNLNRQFIGIEKEEKYYNIAKERLGL